MDTFVGVIQFAKFGSNRLLIVWELRKQINDNRCPKIAYSSVVKKMKKWSGIHAQIRITTSRGSPLARAKFLDVRFRVRQLSCLQNDRTNERMTQNDLITPALLAEVIIIITRNTFYRTRSLSNATFSFLITWRSSSSKSATVYKISWKSSAILELFYHHTRPFTKSLLLAAAACQISCQSDTQIWRYSYLNFSHIWLEMSIQAPKLRVLGDFWP